MDLDFGIGLTLIEENLKVVLPTFYTIAPKTKEEYILRLNEELSTYFQELNRLLKDYANINFYEEKQEKIESKAILKYSYEVSDQLMKILRVIEKDQYPMEYFESDLDKLLEILMDKGTLIETSYFPLAKQELETFHSTTFRDSLESNLDHMLARKK